MNIQQAKKIPIVQFLKIMGINPHKQIKNDCWFFSPFRNENTPSFKVDTLKNVWFDHGEGTGGNIIDLAARLFNSNSIPFILQKLSTNSITNYIKLPMENQKQINITEEMETQNAFEIISLKPIQNKMLIQYLNQREIDLDVAKQYLQEATFANNKDSQKVFFALAFKNDNDGFELRNKYFKSCLGSKQISSFLINKNDEILSIFEGMFDFLSYKSQQKIVNEDYIVLNSIALAKRAIPIADKYKNVKLFFDNDNAGKKAIQLFPKAISQAEIIYPDFKDFNDHYKALKQKYR